MASAAQIQAWILERQGTTTTREPVITITRHGDGRITQTMTTKKVYRLPCGRLEASVYIGGRSQRRRAHRGADGVVRVRRWKV